MTALAAHVLGASGVYRAPMKRQLYWFMLLSKLAARGEPSRQAAFSRATSSVAAFALADLSNDRRLRLMVDAQHPERVGAASVVDAHWTNRPATNDVTRREGLLGTLELLLGKSVDDAEDAVRKL